MKNLNYELEAGTADTDRLRSILDQAIKDHFTDGFLRHQWQGNVLRLAGPGAKGSIVVESGRLRLQAQLRPPASLVHRLIRQKIEAALADVSAKVE